MAQGDICHTRSTCRRGAAYSALLHDRQDAGGLRKDQDFADPVACWLDNAFLEDEDCVVAPNRQSEAISWIPTVVAGEDHDRQAGAFR